MLKELLGINSGILADLHADHEEVAGLMERIVAAHTHAQRNELFKEMKAKLLAHAQAEAKVLYRKMEKSAEDDTRKFAFEAEVEHQLVEEQLDELSRGRNKESEPWTARFTVLKELVEHHVREEEGEGFSDVRKEFDGETLEKLGAQFRKEKEKLL